MAAVGMSQGWSQSKAAELSGVESYSLQVPTRKQLQAARLGETRG
jgi:hypothetical protein